MRARGVLVAVLLTLTSVACGSTDEPADPPPPQASEATTDSPDDPPDDVPTSRVLAVGDIACEASEVPTRTTCRHAEVADLAASLDPAAVLLLGDLQYEKASAEDFVDSFDRSWGRLGDLLRPVPGNHEYRTPGAAGYVDYVTRTGIGRARGFERFAVGDWTVYAVNSNCDEVDCGAELRWLRRELARDTRCSLVFWHHPRYSTGEHGPDEMAEPFFSAAHEAGVELVVAGHDHHYERYAPMGDDGRPDADGTVAYVSGGGGKSHYAATGDAPGSEAVVDDEFGVLQLDLGEDGWTSAFVGLDGRERDPFTGTCR